MKKLLLSLGVVLSLAQGAFAQLSVEKIMQDPKWMGVAPSGPFWSEDGKTLYFSWNPDKNKSDSLYKYGLAERSISKVPPAERRALPSAFGTYNRSRTLKLFGRGGELFLQDCRTLAVRQLTNTVEAESGAQFSQDDQRVVFQRSGNLYALHLSTGELRQWTNFQS